MKVMKVKDMLKLCGKRAVKRPPRPSHGSEKEGRIKHEFELADAPGKLGCVQFVKSKGRWYWRWQSRNGQLIGGGSRPSPDLLNAKFVLDITNASHQDMEWIVYQDRKGKWRWRAKAAPFGDPEVLASCFEPFVSKRSATRAMALAILYNRTHVEFIKGVPEGESTLQAVWEKAAPAQ